MNGNDFDRTLAEWFEADARVAAPADGVDHALEGARRRRPRPSWLAGPGSHWGWMVAASGAGTRELPRLGVRWSTALIVVVLLGLLGGILVGARLLNAPPPLPASHLGHLAYALDGDIFMADWDGSNPVRIADGTPDGNARCGPPDFRVEGPMWSPDGRMLGYRSGRTDEVRCQAPYADTIYISDPKGQLIASIPGSGWRIGWSPDSSRVATWLDLYPMTTIGVYGRDGGRQAVLSVPPGKQGAGDFEPSWSMDGESLLVRLTDPEALDEFGVPVGETWELPLDGRSPRRLSADDPRSRWSNTPSPDGSQSAYLEFGGDYQMASIFVAGADGTQPRELVARCHPAAPGCTGIDSVGLTNFLWSPTGERIAFVTRSDLRVVEVASGSVTPLTPTGGGDNVDLIAFSPEGDRILFSRRGVDGATESLWSVDADGSDVQQLVSGTAAGDWQVLPAFPGQVDARSPTSSEGLP